MLPLLTAAGDFLPPTSSCRARRDDQHKSADESCVVKAPDHHCHMHLALFGFEGWDGLGHGWLESNGCWSGNIGSRWILEQQITWEQISAGTQKQRDRSFTESMKRMLHHYTCSCLRLGLLLGPECLWKARYTTLLGDGKTQENVVKP